MVVLFAQHTGTTQAGVLRQGANGIYILYVSVYQHTWTLIMKAVLSIDTSKYDSNSGVPLCVWYMRTVQSS
jgi:hypothetical protein